VVNVEQLQFYGFLFLLGSFTVASLSDLKRMAAQKEFAEVWVLFALVFLGYDFYRLASIPIEVFIAKWSMIIIFAVFSWRFFGVILSLSEMDLTAACAAMALMNPVYILGYYITLVFLKIIFRPILNRFGDGISMPFLPVILMATTLILLIAKLATP
jgi:hypothetical protein